LQKPAADLTFIRLDQVHIGRGDADVGGELGLGDAECLSPLANKGADIKLGHD